MIQECPNCRVLQDEIKRLVAQHKQILKPHEYEKPKGQPGEKDLAEMNYGPWKK